VQETAQWKRVDSQQCVCLSQLHSHIDV